MPVSVLRLGERSIRRAMPSIAAAVVVGALACGSDSVAPSFPSTPAVDHRAGDGPAVLLRPHDRRQVLLLGGQPARAARRLDLHPRARTDPDGRRTSVRRDRGRRTRPSCAFDRHGTAWCWGDDPTQPGVPLSYRTVPVAVARRIAFTSITVGAKFGCGLDAGGAAYCWGDQQPGPARRRRHGAPNDARRRCRRAFDSRRSSPISSARAGSPPTARRGAGATTPTASSAPAT